MRSRGVGRRKRRTRRIEAEESLEDFLAGLGGNAWSCISNAQRIFTAGAGAGYADFPSRRRELDGVIEQIHGQAAQQRLVGADRHLAIGLVAQRDSAGRGHVTRRAHAIPGKFLEIEITRAQRVCA